MTIAMSNILVVFTVNLLAARILSKAVSTLFKKGFICLRVPLYGIQKSYIEIFMHFLY